jgi:hypothetical protein
VFLLNKKSSLIIANATTPRQQDEFSSEPEAWSGKSLRF